MAGLEDDGKGNGHLVIRNVTKSRYKCRVQVRCNVAKSSYSIDVESRLDVMLHRFLFSQAESPKGSKTQAHSSPFQALERATG